MIAHACLRHMLSESLQSYAGCKDPESWQFTKGKYGKPELLHGQVDVDMRFNLSHTHGMAVVALACAVDIGIDVEFVGRRVTDDMAVAEAYFSPNENLYLNGICDPVERRYAFIDLWTAKEAFIKATGQGLSMSLSSFTVDLTRNSYPDTTLPVETRHLSWLLRRWRFPHHLVALASGFSRSAGMPHIHYLEPLCMA